MKFLLLSTIILFLGLVAGCFWSYYAEPVKRYTCRVYRIDATSDTLVYEGRVPPQLPYLYTGSHGGWQNDFGDKTICRYEVIRVDTIKDE